MFIYTIYIVLSLNCRIRNERTYYHSTCMALSGVSKRLMCYVYQVSRTSCIMVL